MKSSGDAFYVVETDFGDGERRVYEAHGFFYDAKEAQYFLESVRRFTRNGRFATMRHVP